MARLPQTPSQTVGPFFAYGLTPRQYGYPLPDLAGAALFPEDAPGERIRIEGRVLDGAGAPIEDAMVELWQADSQGRHAPRGSNAAGGFGRVGTGTDPQKRFLFGTIKPGRIGPAHAPHIGVIVFARGLLNHLYTRIYFADEANDTDPVLATVPPDRRHTLLAQRTGNTYRFDIHLQGAEETVFFDV